MANLLQDYSCT